jgi:hypothetical protein
LWATAWIRDLPDTQGEEGEHDKEDFINPKEHMMKICFIERRNMDMKTSLDKIRYMRR